MEGMRTASQEAEHTEGGGVDGMEVETETEIDMETDTETNLIGKRILWHM